MPSLSETRAINLVSTWRESLTGSSQLSVDLWLVEVLEDAKGPQRALAGPSQDKSSHGQFGLPLFPDSNVDNTCHRSEVFCGGGKGGKLGAGCGML